MCVQRVEHVARDARVFSFFFACVRLSVTFRCREGNSRVSFFITEQIKKCLLCVRMSVTPTCLSSSPPCVHLGFITGPPAC